MRMPALRLFSPPDFAPTQPLEDSAGRAFAEDGGRLRLFGCGCGKDFLQRSGRSSWMRLLPRFRLYLCLRCGDSVLRWRLRQRHAYSSLYLQAMSRLRRPLP